MGAKVDGHTGAGPEIVKGGGLGLAPCEARCSSRGVRGHVPAEIFGIIHSISCNLVQFCSKIDARFARQRVLHMSVYEISLTGI